VAAARTITDVPIIDRKIHRVDAGRRQQVGLGKGWLCADGDRYTANEFMLEDQSTDQHSDTYSTSCP